MICRGGWPGQLEQSTGAACRAARDYLEQVKQVDLQRVDTKRRDPQRLATLAADVGGSDGPLDPPTVADYLQALERSHLRSKAALMT